MAKDKKLVEHITAMDEDFRWPLVSLFWLSRGIQCAWSSQGPAPRLQTSAMK